MRRYRDCFFNFAFFECSECVAIVVSSVFANCSSASPALGLPLCLRLCDFFFENFRFDFFKNCVIILLFASLALMCHAQSYYKPVVYRQTAPVYIQPAPVRYVAPVVLKDAPKPYSFAYDAPATGGGSSRRESSDGNGRVVGSYSVTDADGRVRVVDYYADETGFHADVKTNEPGTANQSPADVNVQSYAAPVVAEPPKVVVAPARYTPYVAPVRRVVAPLPVSYGVLPAYNTLAYNPVSYGNYYGSYSPYYSTAYPKLAYYK